MNILGERKWHPPKDGKISMICYLYRLVCIYLFVAATEIRVGRERSQPLRLLQAELFSFAATKI